jgi:transposase
MDDESADLQLEDVLERLEDTRERLDEVLEENERLRRENERLREENEQLRERVETLEWKLQQDSTNSHRPPSSDEPWKKRRRPEPSTDAASDDDDSDSEGHHRELLEASRVDRIVDCKPEACTQCGTSLRGDDLAPMRHQVWDVEITRTVREYRLHRLTCPCCQSTTRADWPDGVPRGAFGPTVTAWLGWLTGSMDVSKRDVQTIIEDGFDIPLALGTIPRIESRVAEALEGPNETLLEAVRSTNRIWVDETSWSEGSKDPWLWAAVTPSMACLRIQSRRDRDALHRLIGPDYEGVVTSDRLNVYDGRESKWRQVCWAHLFRDLKGLHQRDGPKAEWAHLLHRLLKRALGRWYDFKDGNLGRDQLREQIEAREKPVVVHLLESATHVLEEPGLFKRLDERTPALWQFIERDGLEPTNNSAERALRPGVVKRKMSYGTESASGSRFVERMLSVTETLKRQGRQTLDYLVDAVESWMNGEPAPSLLPA